MKIVHFADLHLGVENYGRIDPVTGQSSRFLDFLAAFDRVVSYARENAVDLVLFCGDAYKSREPTQTQQREFARRVRELSVNGIPVFLLAGNHDMPNAFGRATATEIFDTLAVDNVYVSDRPEIVRVLTRKGIVQVATLPWLRRSALLSREEARDLSFGEINRRLQEVLTGVIARHVAGLDPLLPAVLAAHVWVSGARVGSERAMTVAGADPELLIGNVAQPAFDYVALGHIHKHQVLSRNPPVVYAGSLERVDFSEEADDKGFCVVDIGPQAGTNHLWRDSVASQRRVSFEFRPLPARRFLTVSVTIDAADTDPTATVVRAIAGRLDRVREAVVRVQVNLPAQNDGQLRNSDIRDALKEAHQFTIARDVERENRLRLDPLTAGGLGPLAALKAYLESKNTPPARMKLLIERAEKMMSGESAGPDRA